MAIIVLFLWWWYRWDPLAVAAGVFQGLVLAMFFLVFLGFAQAMLTAPRPVVYDDDPVDYDEDDEEDGDY